MMYQKNVGVSLDQPAKTTQKHLPNDVGGTRHRAHTNTGITLVALVVTIIVLLILAGVSLNLVTGSNGILGKAQKAVDITNMAKIKEEVELKIAELQMDYYTEKNNFANVNDYVKAELQKGVELSSGAEISCDEDGTISYENVEIGILNPDGSVTVDGELSGNQMVTKYRVTYNANGGTGAPATKKYAKGESVNIDFTVTPTRNGCTFLGWATSSTATTPEFTNSASFIMEAQSVRLYAVWEMQPMVRTITAQNYGDSVVYTANGVSEWKVFYQDGKNVFIIASDYLPIDKLPETNTCLSGTEGTFRIYWEKDIDFQSEWSLHKDSFLAMKYDFDTYKDEVNLGKVTALLNTNNWTAFANGTSAGKNIIDGQAIGSPTLEMWIASWNAKGYTPLYCDNIRQYGYYVGTNSNPTEYSQFVRDLPVSGFDDKLFFPHKESYGRSEGYWLASPSAYFTGAISIATREGEISYQYGGHQGLSLRPVVCLNANVLAGQNEDGSWILSQS